MPNKVSAEKRVRQAAKARERNRMKRSAMRKAIKAVRKVTDGPSPSPEAVAALAPALREAQKSLGKAAKTGLIKKNKAARLTSRMMRAANKAKAKTSAK